MLTKRETLKNCQEEWQKLADNPQLTKAAVCNSEIRNSCWCCEYNKNVKNQNKFKRFLLIITESHGCTNCLLWFQKNGNNGFKIHCIATDSPYSLYLNAQAHKDWTEASKQAQKIADESGRRLFSLKE